ncbi:MAG: PKD domain-containing protein [Propionibacteriaceae bacterium]|nr:PKD domain-containing protein [Propionibacteriaceae bacterium]
MATDWVYLAECEYEGRRRRWSDRKAFRLTGSSADLDKVPPVRLVEASQEIAQVLPHAHDERYPSRAELAAVLDGLEGGSPIPPSVVAAGSDVDDFVADGWFVAPSWVNGPAGETGGAYVRVTSYASGATTFRRQRWESHLTGREWVRVKASSGWGPWTGGVGGGTGAYPVQQVLLTDDLAYSLPPSAPTDQPISVVFTQGAGGGHMATFAGDVLPIHASGSSTIVMWREASRWVWGGPVPKGATPGAPLRVAITSLTADLLRVTLAWSSTDPSVAVSVDWGDGTVNSATRHTYESTGTYTVTITGTTSSGAVAQDSEMVSAARVVYTPGQVITSAEFTGSGELVGTMTDCARGGSPVLWEGDKGVWEATSGAAVATTTTGYVGFRVPDELLAYEVRWYLPAKSVSGVNGMFIRNADLKSEVGGVVLQRGNFNRLTARPGGGAPLFLGINQAPFTSLQDDGVTMRVGYKGGTWYWARTMDTLSELDVPWTEITELADLVTPAPGWVALRNQNVGVTNGYAWLEVRAL